MYNINGFVLQEIGKVVEVVKRKNLSGSYIFNWCSVQISYFFKKVSQLHCIVYETMKLL